MHRRSLVAAERRARGARATAAARAAPPPLRILSNPQLPWAIATKTQADRRRGSDASGVAPGGLLVVRRAGGTLGVVALVVAIFESGASPTLAAAVFSVSRRSSAWPRSARRRRCTRRARAPRVASSGGGGVVSAARAHRGGGRARGAAGVTSPTRTATTLVARHRRGGGGVFAAARLAAARVPRRAAAGESRRDLRGVLAIGAIHNGRATATPRCSRCSARRRRRRPLARGQPFAVLGALCAVGAGLIETWRFRAWAASTSRCGWRRCGGGWRRCRAARARGARGGRRARGRRARVLWAVSVGGGGDPGVVGARRRRARRGLQRWSCCRGPRRSWASVRAERCRRSPRSCRRSRSGLTTASVHLLQVLSWSSYPSRRVRGSRRRVPSGGD